MSTISHQPRQIDNVKWTKPKNQSLSVVELKRSSKVGKVTFVGAGPGDPELLTLKAYRILAEAKVILYDRLVHSDILNIAPIKATKVNVGKIGYGRHCPQNRINSFMIGYAQAGFDVVRLKGGDTTLFSRIDEEIEALDAANLAWQIIPGITAASAAIAAIGQAFTKRCRNKSVRFITGHDINGFADHDWKTLATPNQVTAIYMGTKAIKFIQSRLLMHGASSATAVTVIENVSRPNQQIFSTNLADATLEQIMKERCGPILLFIGIAPRDNESISKAKRKVV